MATVPGTELKPSLTTSKPGVSIGSTSVSQGSSSGFLSALSPILGAAADAVGGLFGGLFNANQAKKNRAFQERMYNRQVEDNIKFWQMQNEYNLPSAQLQRLKDAGLNPLLMYGDGGVSNVATGAPESAKAPSGSQASASMGTAFGQAASQAALINAQIRNINMDTMQKQSEAMLNTIKGENVSADTGRVKSETKWNLGSFKLRLEAIEAQNRLNDALKEESKAKLDEIRKTIEEKDANIEYINNEIFNKNRLTDQEIEESKTRIENSIKETAQRIVTLKAEARKSLADAVYADALAKTENDSRSIKLKKFAADMRKALADADASKIEQVWLKYSFDQMPEYGSSGYKYQAWLNKYVNPTMKAIGNILGGATAGIGATLIKK